MDCAHCHESIDNNSFYCDRCGDEIALCPTCNSPKIGKRCTDCGTKLVLPKQHSDLQATPRQEAQDQSADRDVHSHPQLAAQEPSNITADAPVPPSKLRLVNHTINAILNIDETTPVGRAIGPFTKIFTNQGRVSRQHCRFDPSGNGWLVTDLGSTYGTCHNGNLLSPNVPHSLAEGDTLKIANIEFYIHIGRGN